MIVVPIVNPDGYNLSREAPIDSLQPVVDPAFAYKRKNCRITDFQLPAPGECGLQANRTLGTDPNRNYGGFWGGPRREPRPGERHLPRLGPVLRARDAERAPARLLAPGHDADHQPHLLRPRAAPAGHQVAGRPARRADLQGRSATRWPPRTATRARRASSSTTRPGTTEDWSYFATGGLGFTFEIGKAAEQTNTLAGVGFHPAYPVGVIAEYYGKYPTGGGNREAYYKALESTANTSRHAILEGRAHAGLARASCASSS